MKSPVVLVTAALALSASPVLADPLPGARETFPTMANTDAWSVFDYSDNNIYYGNHEESDGGWLSFDYQDDFPFQIYATGDVGGGAFTGDYGAAGIRSIATDVFLGDIAEFDLLDCFLYCDGPAGTREYYSDTLVQEDFQDGEGWYEVGFRLDATWYYYDDDSGEYVPFEPGPDFPSAVQEVGFRFFPVEGIVATSTAGIDNVTLLPDVVAPDVVAGRDGGGFSLTFTPPPGLVCQVEELSADGAAWSAVPGESDITGPAAHTFRSPAAGTRGIFRVSAAPAITEIGPP